MSSSSELPPEDLEQSVDALRDVWTMLNGRRVFVTGGTGFVGTWLLKTAAYARRRLGRGPSVTVLTRDPIAFAVAHPDLIASPAVTTTTGDVVTFEAPPGQFDLLIHGAADAGSRRCSHDADDVQRTIVEGMRHTLDVALSSGVRRLLVLSSGAVYGLQPADVDRLSERRGTDWPLDPRHAAYAAAKRAAEDLCLASGVGLDVVIARGFSFFGPWLPLYAHFAAGNFIRDVLRGGPVVVKGDGLPVRSYLYAADMAVWLWTILARGRAGCRYNVGSERAVSVGEFARIVANAGNVPVVIEGAPGPGAIRYVPDTRRAREELGLHERVSLEDGIVRTLEWHAAGGKR